MTDRIENKTIVINNAMIPYKFGNSDGLFNMESALSYLQKFPKGIYISIDEKIFDWRNILNNKNYIIFEKLELYK